MVFKLKIREKKKSPRSNKSKSSKSSKSSSKKDNSENDGFGFLTLKKDEKAKTKPEKSNSMFTSLDDIGNSILKQESQKRMMASAFNRR